MTDKHLYPLRFEPVLKDYIWGGRNLATKLGRNLPDGKDIAESWEIAAHPDGTTVAGNGRYAGRPLTTLLAELGVDLVGRRSTWALQRDKFPLLIKILDANRKLSVQVHPDDAYAREHEGNELGKSEMWVVLHAEPGAEVILGVTAGTTPERFRQALADGRLEPHLHRLAVHAGDHICVPAGSLHAILGGLLMAEIQQNSNTTYRVYDWNRVGADGRPRPLHVDKALDVINFDQIEPALSPSKLVEESADIRRRQLCHNPYFTVERVEMVAGATWAGNLTGETFEIWGVLDGAAAVRSHTGTERLAAVAFCLLPAALGAFAVAADAPTTLLRAYVGT